MSAVTCECGRPLVRCTQDHKPWALCRGWRHDIAGMDHSITCDDGGADGESFGVAYPARTCEHGTAGCIQDHRGAGQRAVCWP